MTTQSTNFTAWRWRSALGFVLVALLAVGVRAAYALSMDPGALAWEDEREFDRIGWRLAQTGQYESSAYRATPALPAFLALVYWAFGHNYTAVRIAQALLCWMRSSSSRCCSV